MKNPNINYENLALMANYIETIPQEKFDMQQFLDYDIENKYKREKTLRDFVAIKEEGLGECNTVGCSIGHSVVLDTDIPRHLDGSYDYERWVNRFTGLIVGTSDYCYLFDASWRIRDNTPKGAAERIRTFIANGAPVDWHKHSNNQS